MGHVRPIENTDQNGGQSGLTSLEITYGGMESPFSGVHFGPPPAYIDPKCFADSNNFFVVDNKLVLMSLEPLSFPVLWDNTAGVILLKLGTFFNSIFGQINYALGYIATPEIINGIDVSKVTFYITAWNYNSSGTSVILGNDILQLYQYTTNYGPVKASLTIPVVTGESSSFGDSGNLGIKYGVSGVPTGSVSFGYAPSDTVQNVVTGLVAAINAASGSTLFTATASNDGLSIILTAVTAGAAGNNLYVQDVSLSSTSDTPSAFYFPIPYNGSAIFANLQNGSDVTPNSPAGFSTQASVTTVDVAGTLYISGFGNFPWVLKYSGPGSFTISSAYQGVQVLKKFAGSLIGIGILPQLLNVIQNQDMIFAWSAANKLDEWSPLDSSGNVTGAGFAELDDIGEPLTGLIVSNNVAYIIRSQGLSYATSLGSGTNPFQFAHIGLGHVGEGCQISSLISEYDQTGAYVGNSNVYQISGTIGAIGDKVKAVLIPLLTQAQIILKTIIFPAINDGGDVYPLLVIAIGENFFIYNTLNQTWVMFYPVIPNNANVVILDIIYQGKAGISFNQFPITLAYQIGTAGPIAYLFKETIPTTNTLCKVPSYVTFPQEEVLFGRDVTIDALYVSLWANLTDSITIEFLFNGVHFAYLLLEPGAPLNTLNGNPTEFKVFPDGQSTGTSGVFTSHSPQLQASVRSPVAADINQLRFAKIQEYASFDPKQRPV